jgi:hypothetical protein
LFLGTESQELSRRIIKEIKPLMDKQEELTNEEMNSLSGNLFELALLNKKRIDELEVTVNQTSERLMECENVTGIMEAFLLEKDLYKDFLIFADELVQDFFEKQRPKLKLVK